MSNLSKAIEELNKTYGAGTILSGDNVPEVGERIKSGSIDLDIALNGGYPKGRIIEIYGPESSGKTTLTLHAIANEQNEGGSAAFIDFEHSFDRVYAASLGINLDKLLFVQPDNAEQGMEIVDRLIRTKEIDLIVVDSVAAMTPKTEMDGEMGDANMGKHARLMGQVMRKLVSPLSKSSCCLIFINQLREKIGITFGSPETTTGGNALKFYASVRIDIRRRQQLKDGDDLIGNEVDVKIVKNKVGVPHLTARFVMEYGYGIMKERDILRKACELDITKKSGSWYSYGEIRLGQGENKVVKLLRDNPELTQELENKILEELENVDNK